MQTPEELKKRCEDLYWQMSSAQKGITVALDFMWDYAVDWQKMKSLNEEIEQDMKTPTKESV